MLTPDAGRPERHVDRATRRQPSKCAVDRCDNIPHGRTAARRVLRRTTGPHLFADAGGRDSGSVAVLLCMADAGHLETVTVMFTDVVESTA
jgi:hypothetical protein